MEANSTNDVNHELLSQKRTSGGKERLLTAALELFTLNGLAGTSLQMIARKLGVSKAALYHHFQSKDEIIVSLLQPVLLDAQNAVSAVSLLPKNEQSAAMLKKYIEVVVKHRSLISTVLFDPVTPQVINGPLIDGLITDTARLLAQDQTQQNAARIVVYGLAALVTEFREQELVDDVLQEKLLRAGGQLLGLQLSVQG